MIVGDKCNDRILATPDFAIGPPTVELCGPLPALTHHQCHITAASLLAGSLFLAPRQKSYPSARSLPLRRKKSITRLVALEEPPWPCS